MNFYIYGKIIDKQSRCEHYNSLKDIISIKFPCCNKFYACYKCHAECENHKSKVWKKENFDKKAILCGICKISMSIFNYLNSDYSCQNCEAKFNPNCKKHYNLYFE